MKHLAVQMVKTITRLALENYGMSPGSEWVEARALRRGFSVVVWDSHFFRRPRRRAYSSTSYSWRAFAKCLLHLSDAERINPDAAVFVEVKGETGLVAEILRYAYAAGDSGIPEFVELLIAQRDECLSRLDDAICKLSDEIITLLGEIASNIRVLQLDSDLCALNYTATGGNSLDLRSIAGHLDGLAEAKRFEETRLRESLIAPFRTTIDALAEKFDDWRLRGGGVVLPSKRDRIRRFLEDYIVANGALPRGPVHLKSEDSHYSWDLGSIDFDAI